MFLHSIIDENIVKQFAANYPDDAKKVIQYIEKQLSKVEILILEDRLEQRATKVKTGIQKAVQYLGLPLPTQFKILQTPELMLEELESVRNSESFIILSLDHDINSELTSKTGMDIVKYLQENSEYWLNRIICIFIHSLNPPAVELMTKTLDKTGYLVFRLVS